eukprot:CAMPEP_0118958742 /NCGR_PEP_ID=MMETSP1169-20130426/62779_1 /TAXON_ID=36882 /ORGANISM="Pyramimonas obovata, Strain CCMP722" /LENGTH=308 /DNA_ID=CAMNT_0006906867 /DNA_START=59 /DNA_END=986 /DNA_ORIENTATION=+
MNMQLSSMKTATVGLSQLRQKNAVGNSTRVSSTRTTKAPRGALLCLNKSCESSEQDKQPHKAAFRAGVAALSAAALLAGQPVFAELNKYEASTSGEFNVGSAGQFGATKIDKQDFSKQDFRRANFTATSMKGTDFTGSNCRGAYFIKAVAAGTKFVGTDLSDVLFDRAVLVEADLSDAILTRTIFTSHGSSDVLFDRAVLVEADLSDAILTRTIFTSSDFRDAKIDGADFTDALIDKPQQQAMCKYASGVNPVTGVSTRKSLGCGRGRSGTPSAYMTDDKSAKPEAAFSPDVFNAGNKRGSVAQSNPF